tara:strand:+ start:526 stop:759 length:234 start_codon:yes stop_codon:yes gene_type:complete
MGITACGLLRCNFLIRKTVCLASTTRWGWFLRTTIVAHRLLFIPAMVLATIQVRGVIAQKQVIQILSMALFVQRLGL